MSDATPEMMAEVLTKANEDYSGLYEIVWAFRSRFMPDADESTLIGAARVAVQRHLAAGNIRLVMYRMLPRPPGVAELNQSDVDDLLEAPDSWRPPKSWEDWYPSIDVTEKGELAWRAPTQTE